MLKISDRESYLANVWFSLTGGFSSDVGTKLKEGKSKIVGNSEKDISSIENFGESLGKSDIDSPDSCKKEKNINSKYKSDLFDSNDPKDRLDTLLKSLEKTNKDNFNDNTKRDGKRKNMKSINQIKSSFSKCFFYKIFQALKPVLKKPKKL